MNKKRDLIIELEHLTIIHQKDPGGKMDVHTHDRHEIFIPLQGEITVHFAHVDLTCGAGKSLYIPPQVDHSFTSNQSGQGERMILLFSDQLWKKCTKKSFMPLVMPLNSLVRELAFYLLLNSESKRTKTFVSALFESLIQSMTLHKDLIFENSEILKSKITDKRIRKVLDLISSNKKYSITELAKIAGLSSRNLNRLFMLEVGMTPKNLIIKKKIDLACELLITTKLTVTDISLEVGYQSLSRFISIFQKYTGQLPMEYRKKGQ